MDQLPCFPDVNDDPCQSQDSSASTSRLCPHQPASFLFVLALVQISTRQIHAIAAFS